MAKPNQKLDKNGKPVTGYAAFVAQEWSEINKTRTEKVTQTKFIAISKVSFNICKHSACYSVHETGGQNNYMT